MKKKYFLIILTTLLFAKGHCQTVINGDFEVNSVSICEWNLNNPIYNNLMSNSWGFGNNFNSGIDIQKSSCGYANSPHNIWFVSLAKNKIDIGGWGTDALSLELDANLIAGNTYQISYYDNANNLFNNFVIPLEIGLSTDSLTFGDSIYSSVPVLNTWTQRSFTFVAPNNGKYLTVRCEDTDTIKGWIFVDDFHFGLPTGIKDNSFEQSIAIYPNPFSNQLTFFLADNVPTIVSLYDFLGQQILRQPFTNSTTINTEQLAYGIYFYELRNDKGAVKNGKVLKQ